MGVQNRYARAPLMPEHVASRHGFVGIIWDTRARMIAHDRRRLREAIMGASGAELLRVLDTLRPEVPVSYLAAVAYRAAVNEAVVGRHWTVQFSALDNHHHVS